MPELKTLPSDRRPATPWLPSFDLHEQDGELIVHADLMGLAAHEVEISLDGVDLIVRAESGNGRDAAACFGRLPLPFAPQGMRAVSRPGHEGLEIHIEWPQARG
jgi:HSP20 family molecular chaperone IbpA